MYKSLAFIFKRKEANFFSELLTVEFKVRNEINTRNIDKVVKDLLGYPFQYESLQQIRVDYITTKKKRNLLTSILLCQFPSIENY